MSTETITIELAIEIVEATSPESWCVDVVRDKEGRNCFFGHLFAAFPDEREANRAWEWFEEVWATTYMLYPVNDGTDPRYPQSNPRERVLAYLCDLRDGKAKSTHQLMDEQYAEFLSESVVL